MKVTDKKRDIILYILEKIEQKDKSISKSVSENFGINQNTVHTYINELVNENIIRRVKRGSYENNKLKQRIINSYEMDFEKKEISNRIFTFIRIIWKILSRKQVKM